ncbi:SDR family oxidoreductase [Bdellovibrio sp. HCB-110]|uniref:SDR family oxidoreductase n=1 Tax=Bdellovibrio sp. HCB-110 TaxID=3391182 RepID=UPI0039B6A6AF
MNCVAIIGHGLIGSKIREVFEKNKYKVLILDIAKPSGDIDFIEMNIGSEDSVRSAIVQIKERGLKIGSVINTSYPRTPSYGRKLEDVTLESFNENVSTHLGGYFNVMKHFGEYLKEVGGGAMISFSSVYGVIAPRFDIYENMKFSMPIEYAAVKSALVHLNRYFAKYYRGSDVRFNSISPGGVFGGHDPSFVSSYGKYSLSSRGGMLLPEDLCSAVMFLCDEASKYVNGQNIVVDDGWTL